MFKFKRKSGAKAAASARQAKQEGLLVFSHTSEVIRAEAALKKAGLPVRVMGPPPDLQSGCDMVVVFPLLKQLEVQALLDSLKLRPERIVPAGDLLLEPVSLFNSVRLEHWLMVRAANMKICVDLRDGTIVNVSGGGCPDVPYLAGLLVGRQLESADAPRLHGKTLCSYSLQKAFEEAGRYLHNPPALAGLPKLSLSPEPALPGENKLNLLRPDSPRPWLICGTIPDPDFPLAIYSGLHLDQGRLLADDPSLPPLEIRRGTPALLAAAVAACLALGVPAPSALLVGDNGSGLGSGRLYRHLAEQIIPKQQFAGITFHYLFPDLDGHNLVFAALEALAQAKPLLVADAGYMYVAKMSGYAACYDLFTPDAGELAFLADESAPHPFYTRGFLLAGELDPAELALRAFAAENSAKYLLIKGETDYLAKQGRIIHQIVRPCIPALEPIGGTGDLVAGLATALLAYGCDVPSSGLGGALWARLTGQLALPNPASQVADLIAAIALALPSLGPDFASTSADQGRHPAD